MNAHDLLKPLRELPDPLPMPSAVGVFHCTVTPPGSKSLTNRALLLAALSSGTSTIRDVLADADDARVMVRALNALGARVGVNVDAQGRPVARVEGVGGRWRPIGTSTRLDLHNAGTATRFLAAAALLAPEGSSVAIDGDARMRERPIGELAELLGKLGADVAFEGRHGYPPLRIAPPKGAFDQRPVLRVGRTASSQFISALLLIGPALRGGHGLRVEFTEAPTSPAYIEMTASLLERVGARVQRARTGAGSLASIDVAPAVDGRAGIGAFTLDIEPDASGATYFLGAAALVPGASARVPGLDVAASTQGDARFADVLERFGASVDRGGRGVMVRGGASVRAIDADLSDMPDTAMTAAVVACFATGTPDNPAGTSTLRGLRTLRVKETDRLEALRIELGKIGARVEIVGTGGDEGLRITPATTPDAAPVVFETYNDHRMAMALALVGLRRPGVLIANPRCVEKTYPTFWRDWSRLFGVGAGGDAGSGGIE